MNLSTITFNGFAAQRFTDLTTTYFQMIVDSNTSSGGVTFPSSFTATNFYLNAAGLASAATFYFNASPPIPSVHSR